MADSRRGRIADLEPPRRNLLWVLFADPAVGRFYVHDSPYTYFSSDELHLGEISLECSRAGAAAAALWLTLEVLPLTAAGDPRNQIHVATYAVTAAQAHARTLGLREDVDAARILRSVIMKPESATEIPAIHARLEQLAAAAP